MTPHCWSGDISVLDVICHHWVIKTYYLVNKTRFYLSGTIAYKFLEERCLSRRSLKKSPPPRYKKFKKSKERVLTLVIFNAIPVRVPSPLTLPYVKPSSQANNSDALCFSPISSNTLVWAWVLNVKMPRWVPSGPTFSCGFWMNSFRNGLTLPTNDDCPTDHELSHTIQMSFLHSVEIHA